MRAEPGAGPGIMADKAREHAETRERLEQIEPRAIAGGDPNQLSVLRYGIALNVWAEEYCVKPRRND